MPPQARQVAVGGAGGAASASSVTFTWPPADSAVLIEFPGYVRNPDVAMAVLGGEKV